MFLKHVQITLFNIYRFHKYFEKVVLFNNRFFTISCDIPETNKNLSGFIICFYTGPYHWNFLLNETCGNDAHQNPVDRRRQWFDHMI